MGDDGVRAGEVGAAPGGSARTRRVPECLHRTRNLGRRPK